MLYHFLYPLHEQFVGFGVFKYITFRSFVALFTTMIIFFMFGKVFIRTLQKRQYWQAIRDDGPATHMTTKSATPTMGGLLIWIGVFISILLWARWDNPYIPLAAGVAVAYGLIGFIDDYKKVVLRDHHGLRARYKFPMQVLVAVVAMLILYDGIGLDTRLSLPFVKSITPDLGWWYIPFSVFVVVGVSNAVNLTDGLDGLVTFPSIISFMAYGILAYVAGNAAIAAYLNVPFIPGAGELAVLCSAIIGGLIGFLWFNAQPAEIFMGDVGALSIGAVLAVVALITKQEVLLVLIGGVYLLETVSVIIQVASFKLTGKRVFKMAPIHHHFELKGWKESKVIVRFWIIAFILALVSLSTLKLR